MNLIFSLLSLVCFRILIFDETLLKTGKRITRWWIVYDSFCWCLIVVVEVIYHICLMGNVDDPTCSYLLNVVMHSIIICCLGTRKEGLDL